MSVTRKEQAARTEAALKDAARRVFAERGYLNTKITDITAEAGRASGSFYNHFPSKEALLDALAADVFADGKGRVAGEGPEVAHDLSDPVVMREHVAAVWSVFRAHRPVLLAIRQAAMVDPELNANVLRMRRGQVAVIQEHLQRLVLTGRELPGRADVLASAFVGLLEQFCTTWVLDGGEPDMPALSDEEGVDTLTGLLMAGIIGT